MKRVFIISKCHFPRGSACSNFVQYISYAMRDAGYDVFIITDINKENTYMLNLRVDGTYDYNGITVYSVDVHFEGNRMVRHYKNTVSSDVKIINILKEEKIDEDDIVFGVSDSDSLCDKIFKLRNQKDFTVIYNCGELFTYSDYCYRGSLVKRAYDSYRYLRQLRFRSIISKKADLICCASKYMDNYYKKKKARTCIFPPAMADVSEYPNVTKANDKYRFILPANGKMKDDLSSMLKGFAMLQEDELDRLEIHLCGVDKSAVYDVLSNEEYNKINDCLFIYSWMKYDELISIYQKMHFLILARKESQMTLSNFPSKVPEVMSYGIVPVVSDVGDYTGLYLSDRKDSIFINGSSPDACCEMMRYAISLSTDEYCHMSANAYETAKCKFDYRVWVPTMRQILEGTI